MLSWIGFKRQDISIDLIDIFGGGRREVPPFLCTLYRNESISVDRTCIERLKAKNSKVTLEFYFRSPVFHRSFRGFMYLFPYNFRKHPKKWRSSTKNVKWYESVPVFIETLAYSFNQRFDFKTMLRRYQKCPYIFGYDIRGFYKGISTIRSTNKIQRHSQLKLLWKITIF